MSEDKPKKVGRKTGTENKVNNRKIRERESHIEINAQGQSPLIRKGAESEIAHRAFLLWAMQVESKRNVPVVAKAVERAYHTVFRYKKINNWNDRVSYSSTSDIEAQRLYNDVYGDRFGVTEIVFVQDRIAAPISITDGKTRSVTEGVQVVIDETKPKETIFDKEVKKKHLILIDAAIGYLASGIKDGSLRKNLRDLPTLIALRRELLEDGTKAKGGNIVIESLRVRQAKQNDGDLVEAMLEDTKELIAILEALNMKGKGNAAIHGEKIDA